MYYADFHLFKISKLHYLFTHHSSGRSCYNREDCAAEARAIQDLHMDSNGRYDKIAAKIIGLWEDMWAKFKGRYDWHYTAKYFDYLNVRSQKLFIFRNIRNIWDKLREQEDSQCQDGS